MSAVRAEPGFETLAIHAGQEADPATGAVVPPIYQTSTFKQDGVGGLRGGFEYSRTANPTRSALEECLAALEGGTRALAFASGMAAEDCLIRALCSPGDRVIIPDDAYGGTYRLFAAVLERWGLDYVPVHLPDVAAVRRCLAERPAPRLGGDADQPAAGHRRHRRAGRGRARGGRAAGGGQHVRLTAPAAPAGPRRGCGGALDHQVPGRALRRGRRRPGHRGRRASPSAPRSCAMRPAACRGPSTPG